MYNNEMSFSRFLPRDGMIARYMLWPCVCLFVRHKTQFYRKDERIELFLAWEFPSTYPILCYKKKFGYLQNRGISLWSFVINSGLLKISPRYIDRQSMLLT